MATSYSSGDDAIQHDSDAGESQLSGSTPTGSDIEDEEPQEKEEEPQEEAEKPPHHHNTRNSRGRATTETAKQRKRPTFRDPRGSPETSSGPKREGTSIQDPGVARGSPTSGSESRSTGTPSGTLLHGVARGPPGAARGRPTHDRSQVAEPPERSGSESRSTGTPSGTLLHKFQVAENDGTLDDTAAANHIIRWMKILQRGADAFEAAILKERRKIKQEPLVFAIMTGNERIIDIAHGINIVTMEDEDHDIDGLIGLFLGDRIVLTDAEESHYQDPHLWAVHTFSTLATNYKGKTATAQACASQKETKADVGLLKKPNKGPNVDIPRLLPIPTEWWDFFVMGKRSPLETYQWIIATTKSWTAEVKKEAAQMARHWGRAACTRANNDDADVSCVSFEAAPVYMDRDSVKWAIHNLAIYLPKPKAPPQPPARTSVTCDDGQSPIIQHALSLAQDVIKSHTERNDREKETPKPIPEPLLCRLLGLSGIAWEDQDLLAPFWNQLRQQTDKAAKELVLRNFFGSLATDVPSFKQFRNSTLFDHICSYKFEPGPNYETCHHGISLLAVSMRSVADQDRESQDEAYFAQATNKTPEAVRKHHSKLPPPIPTTAVAELPPPAALAHHCLNGRALHKSMLARNPVTGSPHCTPGTRATHYGGPRSSSRPDSSVDVGYHFRLTRVFRHHMHSG